jgi:hypothetical protein
VRETGIPKVVKHDRALQRIAFDEQRRAPHADGA